MLVLPAAARAAEEAPPAGTYKVYLPLLQGGDKITWLLKLEGGPDKWTGKSLGNAQQVPPATVEDISMDKDTLRFALRLSPSTAIPFVCKLTRDKGARILGSARIRGTAVPAELEPSTLTSLDPFELSKEMLAKNATGVDAVKAALSLLEQASDKKAKPEEVRSWADKAVKGAEPYGSDWHRVVILDVAETLGRQEPFASVALQYARQSERLLDDTKDPISMQKRVLTVLAGALEKAGKADEAKEVEVRNNKIPYVRAKPFAGRKGDSKKVVLVELFTGAECPPCVAADVAFDALEKTFKPGEAVLLQYHLHIPGPDPLTNPDAEARAKFYGEAVGGTPVIIFDGKPTAPGGGGFNEASGKYDQYVGAITPLLEKAPKATIMIGAARKGDKVTIKTDICDLKETGADVRLRVVLVEEEVGYTGGNKMAKHHHVVRALPGGSAGTVLKEKTATKEFTVDLEELRKKWGDYLDRVAKDDQFPNKNRPLEFKNLFVVAFVQNDETGEVLQAAQVEVGKE